MAVLVNRQTASAAEIVASSLQDHQRAVIVGERTFGQGIVRKIVPLREGAGALKLPIAVYYRPSGKNINRYPTSQDTDDWGVLPNAGYDLATTEAEAKAYRQNRFERDKLNGGNAAVPEIQDRPFQKALEWVRSPQALAMPRFVLRFHEVLILPLLNIPEDKAVVQLKLNPAKAKELQQFTKDHLNQKVQIMVENKIVMEPIIRTEIEGGKISVSFSSPETAKEFIDSFGKEKRP